jgi:hypothetical protein
MGASDCTERCLVCAARLEVGKTSMNARQIKDEIRRLNRSEKVEIFRWIDQEIGDDMVRRIGMDRSLQIRQELEQTWKSVSPERQAAWKDCEAVYV